MEEHGKGAAVPQNPERRSPAIAVVGAGYWGKNLIRIYAQLGALRLICDQNETLLETFQDRHQGLDTCVAFNDLLLRDDIEGVVIATPAETHFTLAREAILADKHVCVEKPLVLYEDEAEELIELAAARNRVLMVGHLLQYHTAFQRLKELADRGDLGRINYLYSHRLNLGKIRREENILWSFAPHDISMILSLAGENPESVLATGGNYLHQKIADVTTTHLEFPSGLKAHIFVSWLHPFKEQKLVVVGDRKMAVFDDTQPWPDKLLLYPHRIHWENHIPVPDRADAERLEIPEAEPLKLECEHFLHCIVDGRTPRTDGREALRVLKILNAGQRSLNERSRKVIVQRQGPEPAHGNGAEVPRLQPNGAPGVPPECFAHQTAVIDERVRIGAHTKVWHFSHILSGSIIGSDCNLGQNVVIGPDVRIGNGCKIQNNVSVYKGVTLEDHVFCGPSMVFTNVFNPRAHIRRMEEVRPTLVKKGATLGANCTIVCGCTIGRYAFVGAGATVTKDVPDHALVVGNPGRRIGWVCECAGRLTEELTCPDCGKAYRESGRGLALANPSSSDDLNPPARSQRPAGTR
jgi:UDP-2-acetamido-3-amino-2,3-dideoxy-glucuronate N-acetyltransferase